MNINDFFELCLVHGSSQQIEAAIKSGALNNVIAQVESLKNPDEFEKTRNELDVKTIVEMQKFLENARFVFIIATEFNYETPRLCAALDKVHALEKIIGW